MCGGAWLAGVHSWWQARMLPAGRVSSSRPPAHAGSARRAAHKSVRPSLPMPALQDETSPCVGCTETGGCATCKPGSFKSPDPYAQTR